VPKPTRSATARAVDLLSRRDHARAELRRKLLRKGHSPDETRAAIARVEELGLHDEEHSCRALARSFAVHRGYGPIKVRGRLKEKGFERALVDRAVDELDVDWAVLCRNSAKKRAHKGRKAVLRFLSTRGFPPTMARCAAEEVAEWDS